MVTGLVLCGAIAVACAPESDVGAGDDGNLDSSKTRVVVTTTDFATGAISVVVPDERRVVRDVALASTDAIPFTHDGLVYVVNRFMYDYVDVYDPEDGWRLLAEHPVAAGATVSANPHGVAFVDDGRAFVSAYGGGDVQVHDFDAPSGESLLTRVDLSALADEDGVAEPSVIVGHGDEVWVMLSRIVRTRGWEPYGDEQLLRIDAASGRATLDDLDPDTPGVQGISIPGVGIRQARSDPADPDRILLLGSGIVEVDLAARTARWLVSEDEMAQAGIGGHLLPQSFDLADDGASIFLAAYRPDFSGVDIFRVPSGGGVPRPIVEGLNAVERSLEVVGDEVWFGDTTVGASGMRAFDYDGQPLLDAPLATGLDPYALTAL